MRVTLHPGAEKEIEVAAAFYEREGSAVLAARFVAEVKRLAGLIVQHPEIGSPRSKGRRGFASLGWWTFLRITHVSQNSSSSTAPI